MSTNSLRATARHMLRNARDNGVHGYDCPAQSQDAEAEETLCACGWIKQKINLAAAISYFGPETEVEPYLEAVHFMEIIWNDLMVYPGSINLAQELSDRTSERLVKAKQYHVLNGDVAWVIWSQAAGYFHQYLCGGDRIASMICNKSCNPSATMLLVKLFDINYAHAICLINWCMSSHLDHRVVYSDTAKGSETVCVSCGVRQMDHQ